MSEDTITKPLGVKMIRLLDLVGAGDKIGLLVLPVLLVGLTLNVLFPALFRVGGPPILLKVISIVLLIPGVTIWLWSVILILTKARQGELITDGPYALTKHPLYTGVALLVLPWAGFLLNTWLGTLIGAAIYLGSRMFSREDEDELAKTFGTAWDKDCQKVWMPWL